MTAHPLTRHSHAARPALPVLGEIALAHARLHEICGPARHMLAMLVAAPGQLVSVSYLARDPRSSAMAEEALSDLEIELGLKTPETTPMVETDKDLGPATEKQS